MMIGYLCSRLKIDKEAKQEIIYTYSDGRVTSAADLRDDEASALIGYLVNASGLPQDGIFKMKNKILSMAHEMHWELTDGSVDMERVNNWCIKFSGQNKPLDGFKYSELPALVSQFEMVYKDFLKRI